MKEEDEEKAKQRQDARDHVVDINALIITLSVAAYSESIAFAVYICCLHLAPGKYLSSTNAPTSLIGSETSLNSRTV
jgi:hypothetical protein